MAMSQVYPYFVFIKRSLQWIECTPWIGACFIVTIAATLEVSFPEDRQDVFFYTETNDFVITYSTTGQTQSTKALREHGGIKYPHFQSFCDQTRNVISQKIIFDLFD